MATSSTSQFKEGHSTQRPPLFDGSNYNYWKCRMKIYLQSIGFDLWNIVESDYNKPTTPYSEWTLVERTNANLDAKAMNALFCAMDKNEFNRVSTSNTAHQIWHTLEVTHEGTSKVKDSKISVLVHRFEMFKMKDNETIGEMFTRFTDIINSLIALGKDYTQVEMVRKILRALTSDWEKKTTAIEEANDLSTLTVENLIGNLMAYEVQLEDRKKDNEDKNKKVLAFQASTDDEDSDDEEEFEIITRKFRKFLKKGKFSSSKFKDTNKVTCFGCNKPGHYKKDCPLQQKLKSKSSNNFNGFTKNKNEQVKNKKKKALSITWDDSDQSSSDEEEEKEDHQANMCFMANESDDDQVSNHDELLDAFNELFLKYKQLNSSFKILKNENENLNNTLVSPYASQIEDLKEKNKELFSENYKLSSHNQLLKKECEFFKVRISNLDDNVKSLKTKYETILMNVGKFNKGKENLDNLLSYQLPATSKQGLGYVSNSSNEKTYSSMQKKNYAYLYSKFVKSNYHAHSDTSMHASSKVFSHNDRKMHMKKVACKNILKSNYIWVPKNACLSDRKIYLSNYKKDICDSKNYLSYNVGKPNSYWVWFPKC